MKSVKRSQQQFPQVNPDGLKKTLKSTRSEILITFLFFFSLKSRTWVWVLSFQKDFNSSGTQVGLKSESECESKKLSSNLNKPI